MLKFVQDTAIYGILIPAVLTGLAVLSDWQLGSDDEPNARWGAGLGIPAGYLAAHVGLGGEPSAMPYVIGGVTVVAAVEGLAEMPDSPIGGMVGTGIRWIFRVAAVPAITFGVAGFMFGDYWSGAEAVWRPALFAAATAAAIGSLETIAARNRGAAIPLVMVMLGTAGALILAFTGTARVGEMMGALTATAGATLAVGWVGRLRLSGGAPAAFGLLFAALAIFGYSGLFGAEQGIAGRAFLALALVPHLIWVAEIEPVRQMADWKANGLRALVAGLGIATVVAYVYSAAA